MSEVVVDVVDVVLVVEVWVGWSVSGADGAERTGEDMVWFSGGIEMLGMELKLDRRGFDKVEVN